MAGTLSTVAAPVVNSSVPRPRTRMSGNTWVTLLIAPRTWVWNVSWTRPAVSAEAAWTRGEVGHGAGFQHLHRAEPRPDPGKGRLDVVSGEVLVLHQVVEGLLVSGDQGDAKAAPTELPGETEAENRACSGDDEGWVSFSWRRDHGETRKASGRVNARVRGAVPDLPTISRSNCPGR
ncbi:hypothetical protein DAETH_32610 (plasmid) [Deinococcus aetherius]|uniref:Uncharacterized protein n=1 Tax=Deinococcus aetherius TaxID=200252 RepID=A0ABM8AHV3_9DEIO|nr:hypothetical protein DAETH_32610 [Deinococcus aetherius]